MSIQSYLSFIWVVALILSVSKAFGAITESQLVREELRPIALHRTHHFEDAVAREIRLSDKKRMTVPVVEVIQTPRPPRLVAYNEVSPSRIDASLSISNSENIFVGPTVGTTYYEGAWSDHVTSLYSVGILLSRPFTEMTALEVDFNTSKNYVSYQGTGHNVNHFGSSAQFRLNLLDTPVVLPYLSAGVGGNFYWGLSHGPMSLAPSTGYSDWLFSGIISAGTDIQVSSRIRLGVRGSYQAPLLHKPYTRDQGGLATPGYEDSAMLNTGFYRVMGLVMVSL